MTKKQLVLVLFIAVLFIGSYIYSKEHTYYVKAHELIGEERLKEIHYSAPSYFGIYDYKTDKKSMSVTMELYNPDNSHQVCGIDVPLESDEGSIQFVIDLGNNEVAIESGVVASHQTDIFLKELNRPLMRTVYEVEPIYSQGEIVIGVIAFEEFTEEGYPPIAFRNVGNVLPKEEFLTYEAVYILKVRFY